MALLEFSERLEREKERQGREKRERQGRDKRETTEERLE